jgi:hypothetical protein
MESLTIRERTTAPIDMQLLSDGVAIDLTTVHHVTMSMMDSKNKTYSYSSLDDSPAVSIVTPVSGLVRFSPPDEGIFNYLRTPYKLYWLVYTTATQHYSCPEKEDGIINLVKEY